MLSGCKSMRDYFRIITMCCFMRNTHIASENGKYLRFPHSSSTAETSPRSLGSDCWMEEMWARCWSFGCSSCCVCDRPPRRFSHPAHRRHLPVGRWIRLALLRSVQRIKNSSFYIYRLHELTAKVIAANICVISAK